MQKLAFHIEVRHHNNCLAIIWVEVNIVDDVPLSGIPTITLREADAVEAMLRSIQKFVLKHLDTVESIVAALVREGRCFAQTDEGRRLQQQMARSELVRRLWRVWEGSSLWMFDSDAQGPYPSGIADALFMTAAGDDPEATIAGLFNQDLAR